MISRNDPCYCGSGKKWKKCHYPTVPSPEISSDAEYYLSKYEVILKTPEQIEKIRTACLLSRDICNELVKASKVGATTNELNDLSDKLHKDAGAIPAALHYGQPPFPKGICTSLNEVICHGIPNDKPLKEGDIMNIDVASILDGYYGDTSQMVVIGKTSVPRQKVVDVAYESLMRSISILRPGLPICEIGRTIEEYASKEGCSVVYQFVGHGVGLHFHEAPQVCHHMNNDPMPLAAGMTFTIEPMINAGKREAVIDQKNKWEARTIDGQPSAQWEHTVLITETGHEILTL